MKHYLVWLPVPVEIATKAHVKMYLDLLLEKGLAPKTINERLVAIRGFYLYLAKEEGRMITNPVSPGMALRQPKPLPRDIRESELDRFLAVIKKKRDRAVFMLMLRCGLRVTEAASLELSAIDYQRNQIIVRNGKGAKDRMTYISNDAADALAAYLQVRQPTKEAKVFLVEKGIHKGKPLSVRGIQKRMEHYSRESRVSISCHQLRHNADIRIMPTPLITFFQSSVIL